MKRVGCLLERTGNPGSVLKTSLLILSSFHSCWASTTPWTQKPPPHPAAFLRTWRPSPSSTTWDAPQKSSSSPIWSSSPASAAKLQGFSGEQTWEEKPWRRMRVEFKLGRMQFVLDDPRPTLSSASALPKKTKQPTDLLAIIGSIYENSSETTSPWLTSVLLVFVLITIRAFWKACTSHDYCLFSLNEEQEQPSRCKSQGQ